MSLAQPPVKRMTAEEILAMPDDGVLRELIRGQLREERMTRRSPGHSRTEARIAKILGFWLDTRPAPRGEIVSGEAGFRLRRDPDTLVGIDVAFASADLAAAADPDARVYEGAPVLAVEILSPSDRYGDVYDKVDVYLEVETVVWVVDTRSRSVSVHRPGRVVEHFNE